jgi:tryptophan synthase alpha chain
MTASPDQTEKRMPLQFQSRPTLIAYVTCGDPDLATTGKVILAAIDAGAGIVELGVPFSDPVADGPVIQRASERALRAGTTLHDVLATARAVRKQRPQAGLIVFSYFNPIFRYGVEEFCDDAQQSGVDGALVTDLALEESADYQAAMRRRQLATIFLAAPTSTDERLRRIAHASTGFVYAVSRTGITGAGQQFSPEVKMEEAQTLVRRLRRHTKLPVAVGFGITTPEQFAAAGEFSDGVVVGSAIVKAIESAGPAGAARAVSELVRELTTGVPRRAVTHGR